MGQMRFTIPHCSERSQDALQSAYLAGLEGTPWQSHNTCDDQQLILERPINESGCLNVPWLVDGQGELLLSTASLMEREKPYDLPLELARGTINHLRNFHAEWHLAGFPAVEGMKEKIDEATARFVVAATHQSDPQLVEQESRQAINHGLGSIEALGKAFCRHLLALRHQQEARFPTLLGVNLGPGVPTPEMSTELTNTFNSVVVPFNWRDAEPNAGEYNWDAIDKQMAWCQATGVRICAGPLVALQKTSVPDWIYLWDESFRLTLRMANSKIFVIGLF